MKSLLSALGIVLISGVSGCSCNDNAAIMMMMPDGSVDASVGDMSSFWLGGDGPIQIIDGGILIHDDGGTFTCYQTTCNGHLLACGDCIDNDGDGLIDFRDPECLGPCDNTEDPALTAGVGGETGGPCLSDCYFDFGNGPGNDDCHWDHRCDPLEVAPNYPPEGMSCAYDSSRVGGKTCPATQSMQCHDYCRPLTPNGCDCFGCCTFPQIPGMFVWIGSVQNGTNIGSCTFKDLTDPTKCKPCTPVMDCFNDCKHCELCLGKTELPPDCFPPDGGVDGGPDAGDAGPPLRCDPSIQPCGLPTDPDCPSGFYCITGCCEPTVP
jgi:hypothetical protein